eukprot:Skav202238  [mRNA]  locus=scaffold1417:58330:59841:+ [translate_table: standard]
MAPTAAWRSQQDARPTSARSSWHPGGAPLQKNPWHFCLLGCTVGSWAASLRRWHRRPRQVSLWVATRVELLVDGDCHSMDGIQRAIECFETHCGQKVCTSLFAPPAREDNKKWKEFMRDHQISFRPVGRSSKQLIAEPNDEAIIKSMRKLAKKQLVVVIALLTHDTGFLDIILDLQANGSKIVVLLPENLFSAIETYRQGGVNVLQVMLSGTGPRSLVRAILHQDGSGSVKMDEPYKPVSNDIYIPVQETVAEFLEQLGYGVGREGYMIQKCAKFWFANPMDSLTVFPSKPSVMTIHRMCTQTKSTNCERYSGNLAYFLPITARQGKMKKGEESTFGYVRARGVFKGGGPFMLKDSSELVVHALKRLGYLDDAFNSDVPEAMFLFVNATENKIPLRKIGMLPALGESHLDVYRKLRKAFLSHYTPGTWQLRGKSIAPVIEILEKANILSPGTEYSVEATFEAMQSYVKQQRLPSMRTFNGLAFQILRTKKRYSTARPVVDFDR